MREERIRPALTRGGRVTIDFTGVTLATQSFVHALISDVLRHEGEKALDRMTFKGCIRGVKGIIQTVVQYSLESIEPDQQPKDRETSKLAKTTRKTRTEQ